MTSYSPSAEGNISSGDQQNPGSETWFALLSRWPTSQQLGELETQKENAVQAGGETPFPRAARTSRGSQEARRARDCPLFAVRRGHKR